MAVDGGIPRTRGAVSGLLMILLGAWGGLIPFIGPYFKFAFTPDKAWAYTSGRLYLSVIPGAVTLLAGLVILFTRSRTVGVLCGLLAALSGAWFIAGYGVVQVLLKSTTISPGTPIGTLAHPGGITSLAYSPRMFAEQLGFFTGLGIVIIFIAAIAIGRFSMLAARDAVVTDAAPAYPAGQPGADTEPYPTAAGQSASSPDPFGSAETSQFPAAADAGDFRLTPAGQFPPPRLPESSEQRFPGSAEQAGPGSTEQVPAQDQFPPESAD